MIDWTSPSPPKCLVCKHRIDWFINQDRAHVPRADALCMKLGRVISFEVASRCIYQELKPPKYIEEWEEKLEQK